MIPESEQHFWKVSNDSGKRAMILEREQHFWKREQHFWKSKQCLVRLQAGGTVFKEEPRK